MLILDGNLMSQMGDEHLLAALNAELSPLTSTPAMLELMRRFETSLDERVSREVLDEAVREVIYQLPSEDFIDEILEQLDEIDGTKSVIAMVESLRDDLLAKAAAIESELSAL